MKLLNMTRHLFAVTLLMLLSCACTNSAPGEATPADVIATAPARTNLPTLIDILSSDPDMVLFLNALNGANLLPLLESGDNYVVLVPNNNAFTWLGAATSQLDPQVLGDVMRYHIVSGNVVVGDGESAETLQNQPVTFHQASGGLQVNYANIMGEPTEAANGLVYKIDAVLLPDEPDDAPKSMWNTLVSDGRFTRLVELMGGSRAMYALRFTDLTTGYLDLADAFIAPTDEAFAALPPGQLESLLTDEDAYDALFNYWFLAPDGWPTGKPLTAADLSQMSEIQTTLAIGASGFASGFQRLPVTAEGEETGSISLMFGEARVVESLEASNGVVYAVDTVLIPDVLLEHLP